MYKSFRTISAQVFLGFEIAVSCNDIEIKCKRFDFTKKKKYFWRILSGLQTSNNIGFENQISLRNKITLILHENRNQFLLKF
jgi:hypothetical protein